MRKQEILGLDWQNVDLQHGIIYVLESKSGKPREVPIASSLRSALLALGPKTKGSVFEIGDTMFRRYFKQALGYSGIKNFQFRDCRHTFASHFVMRTQDLPALQKILGHSSPQMTQRYAHHANSHLAVNMATFEAGIVPKLSQTAFRSLENRPENSTKIADYQDIWPHRLAA